MYPLLDASYPISVYAAEGRNLNVGIGQLLQGIVKSVDRSRKVVHMSSDMDVVSKYVVCIFYYHTIPFVS